MNVKLSVTASLPYDLLLGCDWGFFCGKILPHASFRLSSGIFTLVSGQQVHPSMKLNVHCSNFLSQHHPPIRPTQPSTPVPKFR
jgi:hypothetical protein